MSRGRAGRVRIDSLASSKTRTESRRSPDHTKLRPLPASPAPAANAGSPAPHWSSRPGGRPRPAPSRIRGDPELPRDIPARRTPVRTIFTICCFRNSLGPGFAWSRLRISQGLPCAPSPSAEPLPPPSYPTTIRTAPAHSQCALDLLVRPVALQPGRSGSVTRLPTPAEPVTPEPVAHAQNPGESFYDERAIENCVDSIHKRVRYSATLNNEVTNCPARVEDGRDSPLRDHSRCAYG